MRCEALRITGSIARDSFGDGYRFRTTLLAILPVMPSASHLTPMFRQYRSLKEEHPESILLYRMGDFYEMFYDDARIVSPLLDLTLTARGKGTDNEVPMCGFPHHQLDQYTGRLVRGVAGSRSASKSRTPRRRRVSCAARWCGS